MNTTNRQPFRNKIAKRGQNRLESTSYISNMSNLLMYETNVSENFTVLLFRAFPNLNLHIEII